MQVTLTLTPIPNPISKPIPNPIPNPHPQPSSPTLTPATICCSFAGELNPERPDDLQITNASLLWLGLSCVIGIGISWAGFWCQSLVSATKYTVVGVMNKMLTVTLNVLVWDKHASPAGIFALGLCLIGGSLCLQPEVHTVHPLSHYFPICMHPVH